MLGAVAEASSSVTAFLLFSPLFSLIAVPPRVTARILSQAGYSVLTAFGGPEALKLLEERGKHVDLPVTDVVMPLMNGRGLSLEALRRKLVLKALFMSGYTDEIVARHCVPDPGVLLINKPFKHAGLKTRVREVLDA